MNFCRLNFNWNTLSVTHFGTFTFRRATLRLPLRFPRERDQYKHDNKCNFNKFLKDVFSKIPQALFGAVVKLTRPPFPIVGEVKIKKMRLFQFLPDYIINIKFLFSIRFDIFRSFYLSQCFGMILKPDWKYEKIILFLKWFQFEVRIKICELFFFRFACS